MQHCLHPRAFTELIQTPVPKVTTTGGQGLGVSGRCMGVFFLFFFNTRVKNQIKQVFTWVFGIQLETPPFHSTMISADI